MRPRLQIVQRGRAPLTPDPVLTAIRQEIRPRIEAHLARRARWRHYRPWLILLGIGLSVMAAGFAPLEILAAVMLVASGALSVGVVWWIDQAYRGEPKPEVTWRGKA